MTNNEIVLWIYKNVKVYDLITKVVDYSVDRIDRDLEQYIYIYLLEYDNKKLNDLYEQKVLPQFIMRMILNQRNYYRSYLNYTLRDNHDLELDIVHITYEDTIDEKIEQERKYRFINKELKKYVGKRKNLTKEQQYEMLAIELYRFYLRRGLTINELAKKLQMGYNTVFRLMKFARNEIKNNYYKKYGIDFDDINNIDNK